MVKLVKRIGTFFVNNWLILLIIFLAFFLRIYRLEELTTFSGDQGIDLLAVKEMIVNHHWTLLGPKTSLFPIYNGPIYYYMLLPVLSVFKLNPISASYFMIILWLGAIYLTYLLGKELFGKRAGILAALFFSIWPLGIEYSRQSFNSFPTPFFSAFFLYTLWLFAEKNKLLSIFLSGLSFGVMMQLHYFNFFLIAVGIIYLLIKKKLGLKVLIIFLIGFLIAFSPMLMFEIRHDFFNTRTLLFSLRQKGLSDFRFQIHYFIAFFPVFFLVLGCLLDSILTKSKRVGILAITILIVLNVRGIDLFRKNGFTMPDGWNYLGVKRAGEIIAADTLKNFNVVSIVDGDTRAYPFRYIIETKGKEPMAVEKYPQAEVLYVVARGDDNFVLSYPVWEIQSFLPAKVEKEWEIQNGYKVFKLIKNEKS